MCAHWYYYLLSHKHIGKEKGKDDDETHKKVLACNVLLKATAPIKESFYQQTRERELDASCACRSLVYLCARTLVESDYFPLALHYVCVPYLDERR